jgi:hypothetical protein
LKTRTIFFLSVIAALIFAAWTTFSALQQEMLEHNEKIQKATEDILKY